MAKTHHIGVRVDDEEHRALALAAADDDRSISSFVRKLTVEWLRERGRLDVVAQTGKRRVGR